MKKVLFFPYHPDLKTLIDYSVHLKGYQIAGFISYKEDNRVIHSLNQAINHENMPYDELIRDCDAVIILDNYRGYKPDKYYQVINDAIARHKEIYITPLAQSQLDLRNYHGKYQLLEHLPDKVNTVKGNSGLIQEIKIYDIDIPVIGIFGQGKNCGKFESQLLLKSVLEEEYETVTITTNALGALFGCFTIPSFLFEELPFQKKIFKLNYYLKLISKFYDPDVMIIGVPEGIVPFKRKEYHHFAEYPLVVTNAVSIDMAVLCTYFVYGTKIEHGLRSLAEFCQNKFNVPVGAISISRTSIEIPEETHEKIVFEYLDKSYLEKYYPNLRCIKTPIINLLNREEAADKIKMSLRMLQENASAV